MERGENTEKYRNVDKAASQGKKAKAYVAHKEETARASIVGTVE